jgi:hypothetical protein
MISFLNSSPNLRIARLHPNIVKLSAELMTFGRQFNHTNWIPLLNSF